MILDLIYITLIIVGIFYSGFPYEFEQIIDKRLKRSGSLGTFRIPKPFGCQLCMTWWTTLIYIIVTGNLSLPNILICLLFAISTTAVESAYRLVFDTVETILVSINEHING